MWRVAFTAFMQADIWRNWSWRRTSQRYMMHFSSPWLQLLQVQTAERSELKVYAWFPASAHQNAQIFRVSPAGISVWLSKTCSWSWLIRQLQIFIYFFPSLLRLEMSGGRKVACSCFQLLDRRSADTCWLKYHTDKHNNVAKMVISMSVYIKISNWLQHVSFIMQ